MINEYFAVPECLINYRTSSHVVVFNDSVKRIQWERNTPPVN